MGWWAALHLAERFFKILVAAVVGWLKLQAERSLDPFYLYSDVPSSGRVGISSPLTGREHNQQL
jgi:hypothetical protein